MFDKVVIAIINPLGTFWVCLMLASLLAWRGHARSARGLAVSGLLWLFVASLPVTSLWLRRGLEARFPPVSMEALPSAEAIVVLGGFVRPRQKDGSPRDFSGAVDRLWCAAEVYKIGKSPNIVVSGGSDLAYSMESEAMAMRDGLVMLGVPAPRVIMEGTSRNTRQNARRVAAILRQRHLRHVLLVTSALHMPRAKAQFEAEGVQVVPVATDHEVRGIQGWKDFVPDALALHDSGRAIKEWLAYWILTKG